MQFNYENGDSKNYVIRFYKYPAVFKTVKKKFNYSAKIPRF